MATLRKSSFAAPLRELRERAGLTQAQLAQRAGLHISAVTRFEQGLREPALATAAGLAKALAVKVDDFLAEPTQAVTKPSRGRPPKPAPAMPSTPPAETLEETPKKPDGQTRKGRPGA